MRKQILLMAAAVLADGRCEPGSHSVRFDASALQSGVYVVRMDTGEFI